MQEKELFGVIFDLDGVLIDTGRYHRQAWSDLADYAGVEFDAELFKRTFGMQNSQVIPLLLGRASSEVEICELSLWKESRFRELIAGDLTFSRGVERLIKSLRQEGFKIAIGTSAPRANLDFILDNLRAREYFDALVAEEDVAHSKPAPDTFVLAAEKSGLPTSRCIVIEDAVVGIEAAHAGAMKVIAVASTHPKLSLHKAELIVDSLEQVDISMIKSMLK